MNLFKTLRRVEAKSFLALVKLAMRHPLFVYPTFRATKLCLSVSTKHFKRDHYQNKAANAFRHAYWNYLIAKKCTKWSKNSKVILNWTKKITDWHEDAFKNRELDRLMDLHNNSIGRAIFEKHLNNEIEKVTSLFLEMTLYSKKITHKEELQKNEHNLVHLID